MRRYKKKNTEKRNQVIMALFISFLMISSIVGFVVSSSSNYSNSYEFNGQKFEIDVNNNVLITEIDDKEYYFYNYPESVIPIPDSAVNDLLSANMPGPFLTFDPSSSAQELQVVDLVRSELDIFFQDKGIFFSAGVYPVPVAPYTNFPVLDCENATQGSPVIKFINSSLTNVSYENHCLRLEGSGFTMVQLRDSLLYSLLGII